MRANQGSIAFETAEEVGILMSYFGGEQPEAFQDPTLAARRERLVASLQQAKEQGQFPLDVAVDDIQELALPAIDFAMTEVPDGGFMHLQLAPLADYKADLLGQLSQAA